MDAVSHRYAARQVPRYTSYPTAAEFMPSIKANDHRGWLQQVGGVERGSLYIHVPYCRDICFYCGCHSKKAGRDKVIGVYRKALEREIDLVGNALTAPLHVAHLHWGGGTPSILEGEGLASVVEALGRHFILEPGFEHAIELDPRYVTAELADQLAGIGITRVSLGVQDVNPLVQTAIGRIQPVSVVETALRWLRESGISNFNFDLMYGLPLQTTESLRDTCRVVGALAPDRIACYGYAHIPQRKAGQRRIDAANLPGTAQRIAQADTIAEEFLRLGYLKIGLDHYAKPSDSLARAAAGGTLHRNFQGYTDDDGNVLIGFGASAISLLPDGYTQNVADVPAYVRAISNGGFATARGCRLTGEDRQRAKIIEGLLCQFQADLESIAPQVDFRDELSMLQPFIADGLVSICDRTVAISSHGHAVARVIASVFDRFHQDRIGRFSVAV